MAGIKVSAWDAEVHEISSFFLSRTLNVSHLPHSFPDGSGVAQWDRRKVTADFISVQEAGKADKISVQCLNPDQMSRLVQYLETGRLDYQKALRLQQFFARKPAEEATKEFRNVLILTEHAPVFTVGIRSNAYTAQEVEKLQDIGADFYKTNRGGLITFHGPGQLIAYPILNLRHFQPSVRWYVGKIEQTIVELCKKFNIRGERTRDMGVWVKDKKICALGLHVSRQITSHGMALNCNTDLSWFRHIVPCGLVGKGVTSISEQLGRNVEIGEVIPPFLDSFKDTFECQLEKFPDAGRFDLFNYINEDDGQPDDVAKVKRKQ
ncbi:putative lipoyltransferase 2, mitochondrial [Phlebotomus argentipes]|uniref:putative lipoyltransferase 2, mitochondrial n=1 Tax=Phlebotomus argentipes TaxID=94469 RepID=UPI0028934BAB|nr:putative lipoyltransferase 2, mitochondrial [Phlebotomus argentipes]